MIDQMSMPVLFAILIGVLAVVSIGAMLVYRLVYERHSNGNPKTPRSDETRARL